MSKGQKRSAKSKAKAKKKSKAAKKRDKKSSEQQKDSTEYNISSNRSNYGKSKKYTKSVGGKSSNEKMGGLEKRILNSKAGLEALVQKLVSGGMREKDARIAVKAMKAYRKEYSHDWLPLSDYLKRLTKAKYNKGANFNDFIKGVGYLFFALTDVAPEGNAYKDIDEGASIIYIPGYLRIPQQVSKFEKILGKKTAYVASTNIDEIHKIISYAAQKHGRVQVIGFSDGGKIIENYISTYGDSKVDRFFSIAANPINAKSKRIVDIIGDRDRLAAMERPYTWFDKGYRGRKPHIVHGGHTYMFSDNQTMKQIADIINSTTPTRAYYLGISSVDSPLIMKSAGSLENSVSSNNSYTFKKAA